MGSIDLTKYKEVIVYEDLEKRFSFQIISPNERTYFLAAEKETDRRLWVNLLNSVVQSESVTKLAADMEEELIRNGYCIPPDQITWDDSNPHDILGKGASGVVRRGYLAGSEVFLNSAFS